MSNFLQLLSPLLRKFRTSTRRKSFSKQNSQTSSSSENNEDENENEEEAKKTTPKEKSETDPPTNEKQPQLSKATKGIYDLRIDKHTWISLKDTNCLEFHDCKSRLLNWWGCGLYLNAAYHWVDWNIRVISWLVIFRCGLHSNAANIYMRLTFKCGL